MPERPDPKIVSLDALKAATMACRECPIGEIATQSVIGEGRLKARLMLVGEQPGDQEDLQGHPFVGPAGKLLARALEAAGIPREQAFVSNAVKHFKFELRGKRRIHKSPTQREIAACHHWLEDEIALVQPAALVALGATAARSLLGRAVPVTVNRGQWLPRPDGLEVLVTLRVRAAAGRSRVARSGVRGLRRRPSAGTAVVPPLKSAAPADRRPARAPAPSVPR